MTTKTGRLRTVQHKKKHIMDQRGTERKLKASGSQREESDVRGQFGWLVGCGVLLVLLVQGVFPTVVIEDSSTFDQLNGTYNTVEQDAESARGACQLDSQQVMAPRYIVRFTEYRMQDEWKELVESTIHMEKDLGLKWIERNNAARKYPTDFGVVESVGGDLEPREVLVGIFLWCWPGSRDGWHSIFFIENSCFVRRSCCWGRQVQMQLEMTQVKRSLLLC